MVRKLSSKNSFLDIDVTKMFALTKLPLMPDMEMLIAAQRRNLEALTEANKLALGGAQAVARRNLEIMQQTMVELSASMQAITSAEAPHEKVTKQSDMVKKAYERAAVNMKELGEMIQNANAEVVAVLHKRLAETMEEVRSLAERAK